ncbi:MAG: helix-turn-helix domain-containing protein [Bacteroidota bacterium]
MSLAWMGRVWAAERPRRSSHRLLLLALADNANDEGVCWPSVATLGRKCATADRRTVLRQLDWLEREGFVDREKRPGRSTVYHLRGEALGGGAGVTGDAPPPGGAPPTGAEPPTRDGGPTTGGGAGGPRVGDGLPTAGVTVRPPEPTGNRPLNPQQQQPAAREAGGAIPLRMIVGDAAAAMRDEGGEDAVAVLVRRGVDRPVAEGLAARHGAEAVRQATRLYDERRRGPKPPHGPGWLVSALKRGYAGESAGGGSLLTHREMLDWCAANGGLGRTAEFEPVTVEGGEVLFRRAAE